MDAKKYEMLGGGTVRGNTPREIVGALRFSSFNPMSSEEIFMKERKSGEDEKDVIWCLHHSSW